MSFRIGVKKPKIRKINEENIVDFDTDLDSTISLFFRISKKRSIDNLIEKPQNDDIPAGDFFSEREVKDILSKEDFVELITVEDCGENKKINDQIILYNMEEYVTEFCKDKINFELIILDDKDILNFSFINIKIESEQELFYNNNFEINDKIKINLTDNLKNTLLKIKAIGSDIKFNFSSTIP